MIQNQFRRIFLEGFESIFNEIFYGVHYTAIGSCLLIFSVCLLLNIKTDIGIYIIAYLLSLIIYSYDYHKDLDKDIVLNSDRGSFLNKKSKKFNQILLFYSVLFIIALLLFANYNFIFLIGGMILGGILYSKVIKNKTRSIPLLKNIYTAINWAIGGTVFILIYNSMSVSIPLLLMFIFIFSRVLINIIFFDLKDVKVDKSDGLKTLPVLIGKKNTILFLQLLNIISFMPLVLGIYYGYLPLFSLSLLFFMFYVYYYIQKSQGANLKKLNLISYTMADSEFVIWPIVLLTTQIMIKLIYLH